MKIEQDCLELLACHLEAFKESGRLPKLSPTHLSCVGHFCTVDHRP